MIDHRVKWEMTGTLLRHWSHRRSDDGFPALMTLLYDVIVIFLRNWRRAEAEKEENTTFCQLLSFLRGLFCRDTVSRLHAAAAAGRPTTTARDLPCSQLAARFILSQLLYADVKRGDPSLVELFRDICDGLGWPWHSVPREREALVRAMAGRYLSASAADVAADVLHGLRLMLGFGGFESLETVRAVWAKTEGGGAAESSKTDRGFAKLAAMLLLDYDIRDLSDPAAAPYFKLLKDFMACFSQSSKSSIGGKGPSLRELTPDHMFVGQVLLVVGSSTPTTPEKIQLLEHVAEWAKTHAVGTQLMEQDKIPRTSANWKFVLQERLASLGLPLMQSVLNSANAILR
jgi:hypothetical protein